VVRSFQDRRGSWAPARSDRGILPSLRKSILAGDLKTVFAGGEQALIEIVAATHSGSTAEEFGPEVHNWLVTARYPTTDELFTEMAFLPMLELLTYLRTNGFKTFIVSAGSVEFMQAFRKPAAIQKHIGRRPIASFGNSDGDLEMLQWTTAGRGARFALLIHHNDAIREWAYDRRSPIGKLDKALDEANAKGWTVVDMTSDWRRVFAFE
jgi:hypothetical protein